MDVLSLRLVQNRRIYGSMQWVGLVLEHRCRLRRPDGHRLVWVGLQTS